MLKKSLSAFLVLSLVMALIMASPAAPATQSAQASCVGCTENVISPVQLQALLAAENNTAIGHVVASAAFQGLSTRLSANTKFRVSSAGEDTYVVAFEVLPLNHADTGVFSFYHELAVFVVQNGSVVKATVNSRVVGDNYLFYQRNLFTQDVIAIKTTEPMPNLVPPQEIMPITPPEAAPYYVTPGCWVCLEWRNIPGQLDWGCYQKVAKRCLKLKKPVLIALCMGGGVPWCWIPARSYCAVREWSNNCPSQHVADPGAI